MKKLLSPLLFILFFAGCSGHGVKVSDENPAEAAAPYEDAAYSSGGTHTNSIGMEFVLIPAGSFLREINVGNESDEVLYRPKVIVSKPFYLGKYEVTQEQWVAVMGSNPSQFKGRAHPVECVSWNDVQEFIKRLNAKEGHSRYRLPTEAEWESAARGGTDTMFFFRKDPEAWEGWETEVPQLDAYAWCYKNSGDTTHPVGQKKQNQYGLYDVYGNVWEWVQDWHAKLPTEREITDYHGPSGGSSRVERGGGWFNDAELCRSGGRINGRPDYRNGLIGFRLALSPVRRREYARRPTDGIPPRRVFFRAKRGCPACAGSRDQMIG